MNVNECAQKCTEAKTEAKRIEISAAVCEVIRRTLIAEEDRLRWVARDESIPPDQRDVASERLRELDALTSALFVVAHLGGRLEVVFESEPQERVGERLLHVLRGGEDRP
ncbi:MAG: hypothetical protein IT372_13470 [Polyangiaceae bacterium]|nr:hypothetical protein [Polyangiaceae bacterium]